VTILAHSFACFEKYELCILIIEELWQCVVYIFRHKISSQKKVCLIASKNNGLPYFLLKFSREFIDKKADLKV